MRISDWSSDVCSSDLTLSGYGQATWKILSNVELTGGVRYIYETKDSYFFQPYINPALRFRFRQGDRIDRDQSFSNWSPEATATWRPTRDLTLYDRKSTRLYSSH